MGSSKCRKMRSESEAPGGGVGLGAYVQDFKSVTKTRKAQAELQAGSGRVLQTTVSEAKKEGRRTRTRTSGVKTKDRATGTWTLTYFSDHYLRNSALILFIFGRWH